MIEIGNTIINAISIGSAGVQKIDWGNDQVWPVGPTDYLYIFPTSASTSSASTTNNIGVTASTTAWTISKHENQGSGWITYGKNAQGDGAWYSVSENTSFSERNGGLWFNIGNQAYAQFKIVQAARAPIQPFYFYFIGEDSVSTSTTITYNISSAATGVSILVASYSGQTENLNVSSSVTNVYYSVNNIQTNTGHQAENFPNLIYNLDFTANPNTSQRSTTLTFTQRGGNNAITNSITATVVQAPKAVTPASFYLVEVKQGSSPSGLYTCTTGSSAYWSKAYTVSKYNNYMSITVYSDIGEPDFYVNPVQTTDGIPWEIYGNPTRVGNNYTFVFSIINQNESLQNVYFSKGSVVLDGDTVDNGAVWINRK